MPRHLHIVAAGICVCMLLVVTGAWLGAATVAPTAVQTPALFPDETPDPIPDGSGDVQRFFHAFGFTAPFKLMTAMRDESLGRRYYRVRIAPEAVGPLRYRLVNGWTWGHLNRAVYEDNHSSHLRRSHNLPKWWKLDNNAGITLMLDHGGKPNWYVVINADGEVNLMWVAR
jgi:hypothetical protein